MAKQSVLRSQESPYKGVDPAQVAAKGFFTSAQLIQMTGISQWQFRSLAQRGIIVSPKNNQYGYRLYPRSAIARIRREIMAPKVPMMLRELPTKSSPEPYPDAPVESIPRQPYTVDEGILVMDLIDQRKNLREIFAETKIHPDKLRTIVVDWEKLTGNWYFNQAMIDLFVRVTAGMDGPSPCENPDDLLEILKIAATPIHCSNCDSELQSICVPCTRLRENREKANRRAVLKQKNETPKAGISSDTLEGAEEESEDEAMRTGTED